MKIIGIYPGNFQPAHRGHVLAYKQIRQTVGNDVFVVTTDRTPIPDAPLNFGEKENIWVRHGVPASHVVKVNNWMKPVEVFSRVSPSHTNAIFALTEKEESEIKKQKKLPDGNVAVEMWVNPDDSPTYFQPYKGNEHTMKPLDKHGYVMIIDDNFIDGKPVSTTNIREGLGSETFTEQQKKLFFKWAFGWFDIGLFQLLQDKFRSAHKTARGSDGIQQSTPIVPQSVSESLDGLIEDVVNEFMSTMSTPQGAEQDSELGDVDAADAKNIDKTNRFDRQVAVKMKGAAERELKATQADLKWKETDLKRKRADELPNQRDKIDLLNKKISMLEFDQGITNSESFSVISTDSMIDSDEDEEKSIVDGNSMFNDLDVEWFPISWPTQWGKQTITVFDTVEQAKKLVAEVLSMGQGVEILAIVKVKTASYIRRPWDKKIKPTEIKSVISIIHI